MFLNNIDWIHPLRNNELSVFFKFFPIFASEYFYLILISVGYWSWKRTLFRDLAVLLCLSTMLNTFLKMLFQIPRPTIEHLVIVSDPFGFPSGDVQVVTTVWLVLAWYFNNTLLWLFSLSLIFLVGLSRIYLGVHSPIDVIAGILIGAFVFFAYRHIQKNNVKFKINLKFFIFFSILLGAYIFIMKDHFSVMMLSTSGSLIGILIGEKMYQDLSISTPYINNKYWQLTAALGGLLILWLLRKGLSLSWQFEPKFLGFYEE